MFLVFISVIFINKSNTSKKISKVGADQSVWCGRMKVMLVRV